MHRDCAGVESAFDEVFPVLRFGTSVVGAEKLASLREEWSQRERSRWDASDMDGQTREGEASGMKPNQPVRHRRAARTGERWENASQCEELAAIFVTILKRAKTS
jgi:hypothetical protein